MEAMRSSETSANFHQMRCVTCQRQDIFMATALKIPNLAYCLLIMQLGASLLVGFV